MTDVRPITPDEALTQRKQTCDPRIIAAINNLIKANLSSDGNSSLFNIEQLSNELAGEKINWDDVGFALTLYSDAGWKVVVDRPGYNEMYSTTYRFERKK